jgi:CheY-like chemotaxis protein
MGRILIIQDSPSANPMLKFRLESEVCRTLKEVHPTKNIPIVYMSAKDEGELNRIIKEASADGFIDLSFEGETFIERITGFSKTRHSKRSDRIK